MLWGFVFRLALLSLQRLHRAWKQDVYHRAAVWTWQRCPPHLPGGRTHADPRILRPRLQHVLCCPWKPHQKPLSVLPHKGKISIMFFCRKVVLEPMDATVQSCIVTHLSRFCVVFHCQTFLKGNIHLMEDKWAFDQRSANWQADPFGSVPRGCCHGLDTFYLRLEPKVEGPCRFGQRFTWSRCSIHLPLFPSIKNSIWVRKWNLPTYST